MPTVPCPHCTVHPSVSLTTGFSQSPLLLGHQAKLAWLCPCWLQPCINPSSDAVLGPELGGGMERGPLCPCFFRPSSNNASGSCKWESEAGLALLQFCLISALQSPDSSQMPLFLFFFAEVLVYLFKQALITYISIVLSVFRQQAMLCGSGADKC